MDELLKHKDETGPIGDLARELLVIMQDYKRGELTLEEKNELVDEVIKIYAAHDSADKEIVSRWAIKVTQQLLSIV
jgi:hypothetical protein